MNARRLVLVALGVVLVSALAAVLALSGGHDVPPPIEVDTESEPDDIVVKSIDRHLLSEYQYTVEHYEVNTTTGDREELRSGRVAVSNSDRRALVETTHDETRYHTDAAQWSQMPDEDWTLEGSYEWEPTDFSPVPPADVFEDADASEIDRTDDEVVIRLEDVRALDPAFGSQDIDETWTVTIDAETGDLIELTRMFIHETGERVEHHYVFTHDPSVERPDDVPFSFTEYYYKLREW